MLTARLSLLVRGNLNRSRIACVMLGLLGLAGATVSARGQEADTAKRRFINEAPPKWEDYRSFEQRLQGTYTQTSKMTDLKTSKSTGGGEGHFQIKQNAACVLSHALKDDEGPAIVVASNTKYSFQLRYVEDKAGWLLSGLDLEGQTAGVLPAGWTVRRTVNRNLWIDGIFDDRVSDWLKEGIFQVVNAATLAKGGKELVRISFERAPPKDIKVPAMKGSLVLDPNLHWCIVEQELFQTQATGPQHVLVTKEYKATPNGYPIIARTRRHAKIEGVYIADATWEFDLHESAPEDHEFTLSAFGMPEPEGITWDRGPRYYLWFGITGVVALGLAVWFRRLARKRAAARPASPLPS
jgi:hypothetical protein